MTTAETAMAVVSFEKQMKHARDLVNEGHRLLNNAQHNLKAGRVLVRQSHRMLVGTRDPKRYRVTQSA